jgi:uncharacterized protein YecT (DUF1311 family)
MKQYLSSVVLMLSYVASMISSMKLTGPAIIFWCLFFAVPRDAMGKSCGNLATQADMNICTEKEAHASDIELNSVYQQLLAKLSADAKASLRTAEKAWVSYRDAQCAFNSLGSLGGSVHDMSLALCLKALTDQQIKQLRQQLTCASDDVSCGGQ